VFKLNILLAESNVPLKDISAWSS